MFYTFSFEVIPVYFSPKWHFNWSLSLYLYRTQSLLLRISVLLWFPVGTLIMKIIQIVRLKRNGIYNRAIAALIQCSKKTVKLLDKIPTIRQKWKKTPTWSSEEDVSSWRQTSEDAIKVWTFQDCLGGGTHVSSTTLRWRLHAGGTGPPARVGPLWCSLMSTYALHILMMNVKDVGNELDTVWIQTQCDFDYIATILLWFEDASASMALAIW